MYFGGIPAWFMVSNNARIFEEILIKLSGWIPEDIFEYTTLEIFSGSSLSVPEQISGGLLKYLFEFLKEHLIKKNTCRVYERNFERFFFSGIPVGQFPNNFPNRFFFP